MPSATNQAGHNSDAPPTLNGNVNHPPHGNIRNQQCLQHHRIETFISGPDSTPRPSSRGPTNIQAAHRERVAAELDAITRRLP
ncbi:Uu.00g008550.m01.CDS01 [Anthostomella pinea]|uniref:Uu.00g008550.m01.CDS01 n=1 Tax=Anthostomella pinea TaxID=933095 RepID=A0AAI8VX82_9PEZI|nr:Uu.00g008550.m01.CDS01 [Anthostomella pinea]